ncbi:MAG: TetR/AcrR family transcriptional regulator [Spirochaetia bacterium]
MLEPTKEKQDPRIARTRSLLWTTLVALIDELGYAGVSVRDVTTRANVNRSTFYRHFEDKDDLFRQGCSDLYDSIFLKMQSIMEETTNVEKKWRPEYFIQLFKLIGAESKTLLVIGGPGGSPDFRQITTDKIDTFVIEKRFKPFSSSMENPALEELYATALSSIITGLTTRWLSSPDRFTLEEVSNVYRSVISRGIKPYSQNPA